MKRLSRLRWNPIYKFLQGVEDAVMLSTVPIFKKDISLRGYPAITNSPKNVFSGHKSGARVTSWDVTLAGCLLWWWWVWFRPWLWFWSFWFFCHIVLLSSFVDFKHELTPAFPLRLGEVFRNTLTSLCQPNGWEIRGGFIRHKPDDIRSSNGWQTFFQTFFSL